MEVTEVRVFPVDEEKLKAFVSVIFDDCFIVSDMKIIDGKNGFFISMPSKEKKDGGFRDIAHPLNNETRKMIEEEVYPVYYEKIGEDPDQEDESGKDQSEESQEAQTGNTADDTGSTSSESSGKGENTDKNADSAFTPQYTSDE